MYGSVWTLLWPLPSLWAYSELRNDMNMFNCVVSSPLRQEPPLYHPSIGFSNANIQPVSSNVSVLWINAPFLTIASVTVKEDKEMHFLLSTKITQQSSHFFLFDFVKAAIQSLGLLHLKSRERKKPGMTS